MTETWSRHNRLLLGLAAFVLVGYWCTPFATSSWAVPHSDSKRGQQPERPDGQVRGLLKDRLDALRELADTIGKTGNTGEIFRANLAVLHAEFELCDSDRERLAVLEKTVAAAKQFEAHIGAAGDAISANTRIRAKLTQIDAELGLARFKATLKDPAK